ncbi:MAG: hypothetical protein A2900_00930 [Candidatus Chisholmbacteria bacterium RIFCSPLOWO2_01_FULL_50_28]|uniref:Four helix bundle protein n=1 Tax=Candidatus Chisholmbacteria bacterium RIFCSPHIGHO2_01_FULL_52_32 TaxID=1797591 RepID=A0A1G1VUH1_9BACT|nr:MAG: hypothetical protein A2786_05990 [Candidatus Chisholmbacteria bacterium RIFCSPHIGHO2_01_FULL_52_32]OGY19653.1 MAG: hypothetical protein A2900_00930 [Candidatus Chisholmbacteria bacterium RIFCSPLOWO2_01_FULL_50_28]
MKKYLKLNDINCYKRSLTLSQHVWEIVNSWEKFAKSTVGIQYVKAIDSISATISEGFGRFFKKDKILFYRYSLGSVTEALDWTQKSWKRKLLTKVQYEHILNELQELPREIRYLIKFTGEKLKK